MRNLLLIGEETGFFKNLYDALKEEYSIRTCIFVHSIIRKSIKLNKPDLVLCVRSISYSGNILRDIRDEFDDVKMIVISDEDDDSMRRFAGGDIICINKPIKISALKAKMTEVIETSEVESKKSILTVDDSGIELRSIKNILSDKYNMSFATSGAKALQTLEEGKFDLVLLDYEMPGMSGYEVLMEMRKRDEIKDIPVIFLTGVSDKARIMEVVSHHPTGYLLKPIDEELLQSTIEKIFENDKA